MAAYNCTKPFREPMLTNHYFWSFGIQLMGASLVSMLDVILKITHFALQSYPPGANNFKTKSVCYSKLIIEAFVTATDKKQKKNSLI